MNYYPKMQLNFIRKRLYRINLLIMKNFTIFKKILSFTIMLFILFFTQNSWGQVNISAGSTITQNFSIGTSATATMPSGWKVDKNTTVRTLGTYSGAVSTTEQRAGNNMSSTASNGIYNFGAGVEDVATDRSVGGLSSSSSSKSVNVYVDLYNNGASSIGSFTISYNVEKYRNGSNTAGFSIQMYYSTNGSTWTSAGSDFLTSFTADANNNGYALAPGATVSVTSKTLNVSLASSSHLYLAWNYSVTSGTTTSSAQALGIDDVSITANNSSPTITVSPTSLSGFTYGVGSGPSAEQSFTVSGSNLTNDITLTAPTNYEISTTSGSGFTSPITLTQSGGTVNSTAIYVRLKSGLGIGNYNSEDISASSTGATTKTVTCSGSVTNVADWCNVQFPGWGSIRSGNSFWVYAQIYEAGVTDAAGQGSGISAWIGYSTVNNNPATNPGDWTWIAATYNTDVGNNDEYKADIASTLSGGTYYYASRFQVDGGAYKYGGYNAGGGGFWDGSTNVSGQLDIDATVDWCNLQSPADGTIIFGQNYNVYAQIWEDGYTNGAGQAAYINSWIGYSSVDNDPATNPGNWTWVAATYNGDNGNNDEYMLNLGTTLPSSGTYYYASRFRIGNGNYFYGGYNGGFWNNTYSSGTGNKSGQLIILQPTITVSPTSLSNFSYIEGSGPSTEQSFTVSGTNILDNITITAPTNYEISVTSGSGFTNSIVLNQSSNSVSETTIYVRLKASLSVGNYNNENISATSTNATDKTVTCNGTVYKAEPTSYPTSFVCGITTTSSIPLTWTDASDGTVPDGYLIKWSSVSFSDITAPTDGSTANGSNSATVNQGVQAYNVTGLTQNQSYFFKIFPYTNSGLNINYKTDGTAPQTNCNTLAGPCVSEGFNNGTTPPSGWTFTSIGGTYTSAGNYGVASPSLQMDATGDRIQTPTLSNTAVEVKFWIKGQSTNATSALLVEGFNGSSWVTIQNITNSIPTTGTVYTYNSTSSPALPSGLIQFRFTYTKSSGNLAFDDVTIYCSEGCSAPSVQASNLSFSNITTTSMTVSFNRGDGDSVIVVARKGTAVNADPTNGTNYNANNGFGSGSQIGTGNYVIYKGVGSSFSVTNLDVNSTYYFAVYEYNAAGPCYLTPALIGNQSTVCGTPTSNATNNVFSSVTSNSLTLTWTNGNGANRLVLAHQDSPVNSYPSNNTTYTANNNFGLGSEIGTGNFVVYNGSSNSVTVNNLIPGTTYFFKVIEYSCSEGSEKYLINEFVLSDDTTTNPVNVTNLKTNCVTNNTLSISWQLPQGGFEGILVTVRKSGVPSAPSCIGSGLNNPITDFSSADVYCGNSTTSKYVYNSTGTDVTITGLTIDSSYTVKVFTYLNGVWSSGTQITKTINLTPVSSFIATPDSCKLKLIWTNPANCFDEILVIGKQGGTVTSTPSGDASSYSANSDFSLGTELNAGEYVVYKGTENNIIVTNLTNTLSYCFTVFVRYGTQWSTGVEDCETPMDITYFEPTDLAIIAVNTSNSITPQEEFTMMIFKDLKVGTAIDFTDNGYGRFYPDKWGTTEGTIRLTRAAGGTLPKGTSITVVMTSSNGNTIADFDVYVNGTEEIALGYWDIEKLNTSNGSGFNLNDKDDIWVMQGGDWQQNNTTGTTDEKNDDVYTGNVLYGWTATGWPGNDVFGSTDYSLLYPNSDCFTTSLQGISNNSKVRYTGPTTAATKLEWIARIGDTLNWTGYSSDANYEAATPNYREDGVLWTILSAVPNDGIWTGTRSNDWFDCGNWESLTVPNSNVDVLVGTNATKDIIIDQTSTKAEFYNYIAECRNLTINTHNVKLNSNNDTLVVHGNLEINSDTLNMTSGGSVKLYGSWLQSDTSLFQRGIGKVILCGNSQQTVYAEDTLTFNKLEINNISGNSIVLNTDIIISDTLNHNYGNIDLNSNSLILKNSYLNTSAAFIGNTSSNLILLDSGTIANVYFVNDFNLNTLQLSRSSQLNLMTNLDVQNFIIDSGSLTLHPNRFYNVFDSISNKVGANGLIIRSNSIGTASLILNSHNIQATSQRFLSSGIWHYLSSPLSNVQANKITTTTWGAQNPNFYFYNEKIADFWINNTVYLPTGWTQVGGSQFIQTNRGYIHYSTESNNYNLTGGVLEVNNKNFTLSYTDNGTGIQSTTGLDWDNFEGWNLIGNPYTCAIDWDYIAQNTDTSNIYPVIYYYDGNSSNYKYYGSGTTFDQGITINGGSQNIPANQAFFIKAKNTANNQTFTIPKEARIHSNQEFLKSNNNKPDYLKIAITQNNYSDEAVVITEQNYQMNIFKKFSYDGSKPQLFITNDKKTIHYAAVSTNFAPFKPVPIGVYGIIGKQYKIQIIENTTNNILYYLKDVSSSTLYPLFKYKEYQFSQATKLDTSRFYIVMEENHAPRNKIQISDQFVLVNEQWRLSLPNDLFEDKDLYDSLSITATIDNNSQLPEWIEFDGNSFVGNPLQTGIYNIVLTARDFLGLQTQTSFNLIVFCNPTVIASNNNEIKIFPNPVQNILIIQFQNDKPSTSLKIMNIEGKTIISELLNKQTNQVDVSKLPAGVYILNIQNNSTSSTTKFIKL